MNKQAFLDKYSRLMPQLYRVAYAVVGNRQDAVQDAFVRVWECIDSLDRVERVEGYLATAVRNVCLNMVRARRESTDIDEQRTLPDRSDRTGWVDDGPPLMQRLFSLLPQKARRIMELRHVGEYSTRDIARITGETESNVRSTLCRARQQLRDAAARMTND